jgi:hypothetical protein
MPPNPPTDPAEAPARVATPPAGTPTDVHRADCLACGRIICRSAPDRRWWHLWSSAYTCGTEPRTR